MTNKNYNAGRRFEYRVKKWLENMGFVVFRTAGSHSPVDLISFESKFEKTNPKLIQCKYTKSGNFYMSKKDIKALEKLIDELCVEVYVAFNDEKGHIHLRYVGDL